MIAICALGWNHADVTERWLNSVRRNSGGHEVELFLMDNGSTDNTSIVMRSFGPRIFLRNEGNESIYKGWNTLSSAALAAGADIVLLSNNDLVVGPGWLDPVARELQPGVKKYCLPNGEVNCDPHSFAGFDAQARSVAQAKTGQVHKPARAGWCLMFHREAIPLFHPIPEELQLWYGDDWVHHKLGQAGYSCEALLDCVVAHFTSTTIFTRPGYDQIVAQDREVYFRITGERL